MGGKLLSLGLIMCVAATTAGCCGARVAPRSSGSMSDAADEPAPPPVAAPPAPAPGTMPAPMPPPGWTPESVPVRPAPLVNAPPYCPPPPCPPPCAPSCPPPACGLPCENGAAPGWHVRAVAGLTTWFGTDAGDDCAYFGADFGRSFCNTCWGIDVFWRGHTAQFERSPVGEDGGMWNHVGVKATFEKSFGGSRWYGWVGAGPEYFWTSDYLHDDSGFGVYGEAGIGYVVNRNLRIRAGFGVHGMDTDAGRFSPAEDGESRWLWVLAPMVGLELDF